MMSATAWTHVRGIRASDRRSSAFRDATRALVRITIEPARDSAIVTLFVALAIRNVVIVSCVPLCGALPHRVDTQPDETWLPLCPK